MRFLRVNRSRPCPVCGADKFCGYTDDGNVINCGSAQRGGDVLPAPNGYRLSGSAKNGWGTIYKAVDQKGKLVRRVYSAEEVRQRAAEQERAERRQLEKAHAIWEGATGPVDRVVAYLEARGIPVAALPGGQLGTFVRFHPACPDWDDVNQRPRTCPAVVVRAMDGGTPMGVHITFLDPGGKPAKRDKEIGKQKQMIGRIKGAVLRACDRSVSGVLVLAEGLENALTVAAATGYAAWYIGSADHLQQVRLADTIFVPRGPIHTVILAGDRNKNGKGEDACAIASNVIRTAAPWINVEVRIPGPREVPQAFGADGGMLTKGVDWNDAVKATGLETVRMACSVDIEAFRATAADRHAAIVAGTRASDSRGGGGVDGAVGACEGVPDDAQEPGAAPMVAGRPWERPPAERLPVIEGGDLPRARRWLCEKWYMEGARRFRVARWGGKWWIYHGGRYIEVAQERMQAMALQWLDGFSVEREFKSRDPERRYLDPTSETAKRLLESVVVDTNVDGVTIPRWLPPVLGPDGLPRWGEALSGDHLSGVTSQPDASAVGQINLRNGRIDLAEIVRREEVRLLPHTPDLFSTVCLPFDLDVARLTAIVEGGNSEKIFHEMCPSWMAYLDHASGGDAKWRRQLQLMFGDTVSGDRTMQSIFVLAGAPSAGKTTVETALKAVVGDGNFVAPSLASLAGQFGLAPLSGKMLVVFSDAQPRAFAEAGQLVEILKTISGGGSTQLRDLYEKAVTVVLPCRMWMFSNEIPDLRDDSGGLARRLVVLPFEHPIRNADPAYMSKVVAEAPGILLWALMGALELARMERRSIVMSERGQDAYDENVQRTAQSRAFVEECMERSADSRVTLGELYRAYEAWCKEQDREPFKRQRFDQGIRWQLGGAYRFTQARADDGSRTRAIPGWRLKLEWMYRDAHGGGQVTF